MLALAWKKNARGAPSYSMQSPLANLEGYRVVHEPLNRMCGLPSDSHQEPLRSPSRLKAALLRMFGFVFAASSAPEEEPGGSLASLAMVPVSSRAGLASDIERSQKRRIVVIACSGCLSACFT